ncbi:MAG: histidine kinase [Burkholderiaceae bacterium]|nr:histidine kinase [Burkholderiaceae bacterium]
MHPIFSSAHRLQWYASAWLFVGAMLAASLVAAGDALWTNALFFALPVCLLYSFIALSAYYVCRSLPLAQRQALHTGVSFAAAAVIAGLTLVGIGTAWTSIGRSLGIEWGAFELTRRYQVLLFGLGVALYLLSLFAHDGLIALENLRSAERREADSRALAREAELQALRAQINPHFLFNSLNSISALTSLDAAAARTMTIALAQFFRQTLALGERQKIALSEEIGLCESFLTVEKIRFGKKLDAAWHVQQAALPAAMPAMVLQPLLENAIKHGIRDLSEGGVIEIAAEVREGWLRISVNNPCSIEQDTEQSAGNPTNQGNPRHTGIGLQNIRQRLAAMFDGRARIACRRDDRQFIVELTIPFLPLEDTPGRPS